LERRWCATASRKQCRFGKKHCFSKAEADKFTNQGNASKVQSSRFPSTFLPCINSHMVRTRFAPSPTGYLHIGGVRTALFCWLFARRHGGQFILRIDDTDQQRNVEEALAPILHGLKWLGIDWDEGPEVGGPHAPYYQSQRADRYQAAVDELLARGAAYRDYATTEEIQAEREAAEREKRLFLYSRRFMAERPDDCARFEAEGRRAVVRLKMPREGKLVIHDLVRGDVEVQWSHEQDHVVQRADGSCIYHLANVVDDHDFEITHVIRAEEHLSNTPRQVFIIQALGYPLPEYAHLPFVAEPGSKTKLSKRKLDKYLKNPDFASLMKHGRKVADAMGLQVNQETFNPVVVDFYEEVGYLSEAIVNYLALLGWSLDDKSEDFDRDQLIKLFSLDRVGKSAASFDPKKLWAFQERHMQRLPLAEKTRMAMPFLQRAGLVASPPSAEAEAKVTHVVEAANERIKTAGDVLDYAYFFVSDDKLTYDDKAFQKGLGKPDAADLLTKYRADLAAAESFDGPALEQRMHQFVEAQGIKIGDIIHAIRVAVTGQSIGLGLFDSLAILGRERSLARIDRALERV
jgi:glutamyl-tRNA synthetase